MLYARALSSSALMYIFARYFDIRCCRSFGSYCTSFFTNVQKGRLLNLGLKNWTKEKLLIFLVRKMFWHRGSLLTSSLLWLLKGLLFYMPGAHLTTIQYEQQNLDLRTMLIYIGKLIRRKRLLLHFSLIKKHCRYEKFLKS